MQSRGAGVCSRWGQLARDKWEKLALNARKPNLDEHGGPICAGMRLIELVMELSLLASQMPDSEGHFHYADPSGDRNERRRKLAEELYQLGVW